MNAQIPLHKDDVDRLRARLGNRLRDYAEDGEHASTSLYDHVEDRGLVDPALYAEYRNNAHLTALAENVESTAFHAITLRLTTHPTDPDFLVCTLLEDGKGCTVGEDRPLLCRTYPLTVQPDGRFALLSDDSYCLAIHEDAMTTTLDNAQPPFSGVRQRLNITDSDLSALVTRYGGRR